MNLKIMLLIVWLSGLIVSHSAIAKDYIIEVIIFSYVNGKSQVSSHIPAQQMLPVAHGENLLALRSIGVEPSSPDEPVHIWQLLDASEHRLDGVAKEISSSPNYRLLQHFAWQQPRVNAKQSVAINIQLGKDYTQQFPRHETRLVEFSDRDTQSLSRDDGRVRELEGTIKVGISRYLHVYSDMVYRLPRTVSQTSGSPAAGDTILVDYPVKSHRHMRSKELHYIDNPLVGIVVEAWPVEDPSPE